MPEPSAKSAAERRLERVHSDDDDPATPEDVHEAQVNLERDLSALIASHPSISMSDREVLEAAEYDLNALRAFAADLFPSRFGGEAGA
jgi:hypothetical protein